MFRLMQPTKISPFADCREGKKVHLSTWGRFVRTRFAIQRGKRCETVTVFDWRRAQQKATWLGWWDWGQEQGKQGFQETDCNRRQWNGLWFYHLLHRGSQDSPAWHQKAHPRNDKLRVQHMWVVEFFYERDKNLHHNQSSKNNIQYYISLTLDKEQVKHFLLIFKAN